MGSNIRRTVQLGDLVVAAFDEAARHSSDPQQVCRMARKVVMHVLRSGPPRRAASNGRRAHFGASLIERGSS